MSHQLYSSAPQTLVTTNCIHRRQQSSSPQDPRAKNVAINDVRTLVLIVHDVLDDADHVLHSVPAASVRFASILMGFTTGFLTD